MSDRQRLPSPAHPDSDRQPDAAWIEALNTELRTLPELEAPERVWRRVRAQVSPARLGGGRPLAPRRLAPYAMAASVLLAAATAVFVGFATDPNASDAPPGRDRASELATLLERSRLLEARRSALPALQVPTGVERMLRARVGGIDASLNRQLLLDEVDSHERERLLRRRVELMRTLADIEHYQRHELVRQAAF